MFSQTIIFGNAGSTPELKQTNNGTNVTNFSVAVTEKWTDKDGTKQERTEWYRCVAWQRLAEIAAQYITKGMKVQVVGKHKTREYDKDGVKTYVSEIVVSNLSLGGSANGNGAGGQQAPQEQQAPQNAPQSQAPGDDKDLPF